MLNVMAPIKDRLDSKLDCNGRFHNSVFTGVNYSSKKKHLSCPNTIFCYAGVVTALIIRVFLNGLAYYTVLVIYAYKLFIKLACDLDYERRKNY
jgi:hypothetical protein